MTTWSDYDIPAGAGGAARAAPAGGQGRDFRDAWRKARAARGAALRRRTGRHRVGGYRAGMARRPPPGTDGDQAA